MAIFTGVEASIRLATIRLCFSLDAPRIVGWQIYDPSTGAFLFEGEWIEADGRSSETARPAARRRRAVSRPGCPVEDRDAIHVDRRAGDRWNGRASRAPRVTSGIRMARERLLRAIPKAFTYPPRSLWRNRKLMRSMVRRDILARYRGSFGGALWTFLNPLLLMATYAFRVRRGAETALRSGYHGHRICAVFSGRDAAVAGVFGSRGARAVRDSGAPEFRQETGVSARNAAGEPGDFGRGDGGVRPGDFHRRIAGRAPCDAGRRWSGCRC